MKEIKYTDNGISIVLCSKNDYFKLKMYWFEEILNDQNYREINSYDFSFLRWLEDKTSKGSYKLLDSKKTIGDLVFNHNSYRSAEGRIYNQKFTIRKRYFFTSNVIIKGKDDSDNPITLKFTDWDGSARLDFSNDIRFFWKQSNRLNNGWLFSNEREKNLISFKPVSSFYKSGCAVKIKDDSLNDRTIAIMLLTGLFALVGQNENSAIDAAFL